MYELLFFLNAVGRPIYTYSPMLCFGGALVALVGAVFLRDQRARYKTEAAAYGLLAGYAAFYTLHELVTRLLFGVRQHDDYTFFSAGPATVILWLLFEYCLAGVKRLR